MLTRVSNLMSPSFNFCMFTEEDGTTINNKTKRILNKKKCLNLLNFVTFKELLEKSTFLNLAAQAFEAGDFLNIF